jgi:serine/threonine protein kinase
LASWLPIDDRTDIYPLGVILYEIFTGKFPFGGDGTEILAIIHQHIYAEPAAPELINPNVITFIPGQMVHILEVLDGLGGVQQLYNDMQHLAIFQLTKVG